MEPSKSDWKLFSNKIPGWQEAYMERLVKEYIELLSSGQEASHKFWALEKRIKQDKQKPGVIIERRRSLIVINLARLVSDGAISFDDLNEFSDELRAQVEWYLKD